MAVVMAVPVTRTLVYIAVILVLGGRQNCAMNDTTTNPISRGTTDGSSQPTFTSEFKRVCRGTSTGLGHSSGHVEQYRAMYTNCTYVDGNLEIVFVDKVDADLSFLRHIREVTGYVLIVANFVDYIPLTSLRIIRGRTLYEDRGRYYSLYIALNYDARRPNVGLKELRFTSLHEIFAGNVFFFENNELCFEDTVNWKDILTGEGAEVYGNKSTGSHRTCPQCHASCVNSGQLNCWGSGPEYCQKLTKLSCSPQCDGRCFGRLPNECCHPECAGGCSGPTKSECWACKNFDNDELCENFCPPEYIYSPTLFRQVPNPRAKFSYGSLCVDKCPSHLMADKGACVQDCGTGRIAGKDNKCVDCNGPCPKACVFTGEVIHAHNILNLTGCTIIQGHIKILESSFAGDSYMNIPTMPIQHLSALESVREVTDYVMVQANSPRFRNLSFLQSLEVIHGRSLGSGGTSLQVFQTSIEYLGLVSLREIRNGHVYIANNSRLCYASTVNWVNIRASAAQKVIIQHNRNSTVCEQDNEVCSAECTPDGCWGPWDDQCIQCRHYHLGKRCLNTCKAVTGVYKYDETECRHCHPECISSCLGDGANQCDECRNTRDGPYCVPECPISKYRDENSICQLCHENCAEGVGCTGPRNSIGEGACRSCSLVVVADDNTNISHCLPPDSPCDAGYYKHFYSSLPGVQACFRCHPECRTCIGQGLSFCEECVHFRQDERCVASCSADYYVKMRPGSESGQCERCDPRCLSCTGPTAGHCLTCRQYKIYLNYAQRDIDPRFNCTEKCPDSAPFKETIEVNGESETVCVTEDSFAKKRMGIIVGTTIGGFTLVTLIVVFAIVLCIQKQRAERDKVKLSAKMIGCDESVPLSITGAEPDMSMLLLIKESDLSRGQMIGSGAFGTVYKGMWQPCPNDKNKVPVAIKILQEGTSPTQNKELLEEARIMASVVHPCCVQILAVCMTAQIMLISELMPLGCLLDFVRKNHSKISSHMLLLWSRQIALGMAHLESKLIVHRDLAARNVLVQNMKQVKITDFGLAKLLAYREDQFYSSGGKMPIKWLALECLQHRKFTHKSDVWSFGVTLWELYTFGQRPYENVRAIDLPNLLEKGERLCQPPICTIDVYMLMVKCWTLDAECRPKFTELAEEFEKMLQDPPRYIFISTERLQGELHQPFMDPAHADYSHSGGRYLPPLQQSGNVTTPMDKVIEEDTDVFRTAAAAGGRATVSDRQRRESQRRQGAVSGAAARLLPSSARRSVVSRYCSDPCIQVVQQNSAGMLVSVDMMADNGDFSVAQDDGYILPTETPTSSMKYVDLVNADKVDHEDDDGFDSESTITPISSHNDYYNSEEQIPLKGSTFKGAMSTIIPSTGANGKGSNKLTARGNSESIGSLDTDATGSAGGEDDLDHDYYNEFTPDVKTEEVLLKPAVHDSGTACWSAAAGMPLRPAV